MLLKLTLRKLFAPRMHRRASRSRRLAPRRRFAAPVSAGIERLEDRTLLAVFAVNSLVDSVDANPGDGVAADSNGNTSLRAAIMEANALAGADEITLFKGNFFLTLGGTSEDAAATGDLDITDDLTITGAGGGHTGINAAQLDRVFHIVGVGGAPAVSISGVNITEGLTTGGFAEGSGGGILNEGGSLTVADSIIVGNRTGDRASGSVGQGGGIASLGGTLLVTNSLVTHNDTGSSTTGGDGGGIAGFNATITIRDSVISNNQTGDGSNDSPFAGRGGGIAETGSSGLLTIIDSTISDNVVGLLSYGPGGGVYTEGTLIVENSTVSGNSAAWGGGISIEGGTVTRILDSTISGNSTEGRDAERDLEGGGGIHNNFGTIQLISGTTLSGNTVGSLFVGVSAGGGGGGLFSRGRIATIENSTISGNSVAGSDSAGGGLLIEDDPNTTTQAITWITNVTIAGNSARDGGGIFLKSGTIGEFVNTIVADNTATGSTAADFRQLGTVNAKLRNLIEDPDGHTIVNGGVGANIVGVDPLLGSLAENGGPTQTHALLAGSPALDAAGNNAPATDQRGVARPQGAAADIGAFEFASTRPSIVVDTLMDEHDGNYAAGDVSLREATFLVAMGGTITFAPALSGGTIVLGGSQIVLALDMTIQGPGAANLTIDGDNASRIFLVNSDATVDLSGLTLTRGRVTVSDSGGGIDNRGTLTLTDTNVSGNFAANLGGAVWNTGGLTINDSTLTGNAGDFGGGAIFNTGTVTVAGSNFANNSTFSGGAIKNSGGTVDISGSTFSENLATDVGGAIDNRGVLTMTDTTLDANTASIAAALFNAADSQATLAGVTVSGNHASSSGGGMTNGGTLTLVNSTLSANSTDGVGGALVTNHPDSTTELRNVTIFGNRARDLGGGYFTFTFAATVSLHNTLIAGNLSAPGGADTPDDLGNATGFTAATHNLIGVGNGSIADGVDGNIVGIDWTSVIDPVLSDNGGPTRTHALLFGGAALDAGSNVEAPATDQRSFLRPVNGNVDIGAFEFGAVGVTGDSFTIQLSRDGLNPAQPRINDRFVAWQARASGEDYEIFLYDGTTIRQLTDNTLDDTEPRVDALGNVVWRRFDGNDSEVMFFDGTTVRQLTDNTISDFNPEIDAGQVVWKANGIFLFDSATNTTTQLSTSVLAGQFPRIDAGQVVWTERENNQSDDEVFLYDGTTVGQLTDNTVHDRSPDIDAGQVAWLRFDGNDDEIFWFDGSTTLQVTDNGTNDGAPQIDGGQLAWTVFDGSDSEVYFFDGSTLRQVTDNSTSEFNLRLAGGLVVWSASDGSDTEVFLFDGTTTRPVTDDPGADVFPDLQSGRVVYAGQDDTSETDREIFLAIAANAVQGQSFYDADRNGSKDPQEIGLNGRVIRLLDAAGGLVATTLTTDIDLNADGSIDPKTERGLYLFTELPPQTYSVVEVPPPDWQQTIGSRDVPVVHGQAGLGQDFGSFYTAFPEYRIGLNFSGTDRNDLNASSIPDTMGAVGPSHIVELLNPAYAVYDKATGSLLTRISQDDFWNTGLASGGGGTTLHTADPRIVYDHASGRWFASSMDRLSSPARKILVGVSNSSDPTDGWKAFLVDPDPNDLHIADFPTLGVDADGVYINVAMRDWSGDEITADPQVAVTVISIPKADLVTTTPTVANATVFALLDVNASGGANPSTWMHAAVDFGASEGRAPMISGVGGRLARTDILNAAGPGSASFTSPRVVIEVPYSGEPPDAPQPGTTTLIETGASFVRNSVVEQGDILWAVRAENVNGRSGIRWFKVEEPTNALLQSGTIGHPELHFYYPSIAVNEFGDVVIGFSGSSSSQYPSAYATAGRTVDGATVFGDVTLLQAGQSNFLAGFTGPVRWGDYSATVRDPVNPLVFWTFQEYANAEGDWAMQIAEIDLSDGSPGIPGFATTETGGATEVSENSAPDRPKLETDTFTIVLASRPAMGTRVVLDISSSDMGEATVNPAQLAFNPSNWDQPQTVTVQGINDDLADGDQEITITILVNDGQTTDDSFDPLADQTLSVTVLDVPVTPTMLGPLTGQENVPSQTTFTWEAVAGADSYNLWLIDRADGTLEFSKFDITGTSFQLPAALDNGEYRYWFSANNANGFSNWSGPHDFSVGSAATVPAVPTGFETSDSGDPERPTITWAAVSGASFYNIWLVNLQTGGLVASDRGLTTPSFTPSTDLAEARHRIYAQAGNVAGTSAWSAPFDFNVGATIEVPAAPTDFSTTQNTDPQRPTVGWNAVSGAAFYNIWLVNLATGDLVASDRGLETHSFTPPGDLDETRHRIYVQAGNLAGTSGWSAPFDFDVGGTIEVPAAPTGLGVTNADTARPTILWNESAGATHYAIWFVNLDTDDIVSSATNLTDESFKPDADLTNGDYRFYVRALNAAGTSGWAGPLDFSLVIAGGGSAPLMAASHGGSTDDTPAPSGSSEPVARSSVQDGAVVLIERRATAAPLAAGAAQDGQEQQLALAGASLSSSRAARFFPLERAVSARGLNPAADLPALPSEPDAPLEVTLVDAVFAADWWLD